MTTPGTTTRERYRSRSQQRPSLSPNDMAAQLVADIIHQKVEAQERADEAVRMAVVRKRRRGRGWYFLVALPMFVGLTAWNFARAAHPPAVYTASERESGVRFRMFLAAQAVEAYRDSLGRWPATLAAVGFGDAGFTYSASARSYEITDTSSAVPLEYRRGDMLEPFADAYNELAGTGPK